jgi:hypothetical protein
LLHGLHLANVLVSSCLQHELSENGRSSRHKGNLGIGCGWWLANLVDLVEALARSLDRECDHIKFAASSL